VRKSGGRKKRKPIAPCDPGPAAYNSLTGKPPSLSRAPGARLSNILPHLP